MPFFGSLLKYAKYQITSTATYRIQSEINDSSIVRDWLEIEFEIQHLGLRIWRDFKQKSKQRWKIWEIWKILRFALKDWANPIGRDNWRIFIWRGFRFCLLFKIEEIEEKKINCIFTNKNFNFDVPNFCSFCSKFWPKNIDRCFRMKLSRIRNSENSICTKINIMANFV